LTEVPFDNNGDLDCESFLLEVRNGQQVVVATLPSLGAAATPIRK
jgi:branched-chain amino acid transport system substrate-binding protein